MKFQTFWPSYLRAHRQPGTRALHYFATGLGIIVGVEAVFAGQILIFVGGIAGCYVIAVLSHWLVERNQPMIVVGPVWGALADLYMAWLAVRGRLHGEYVAHGILAPANASPNKRLATAKSFRLPGRYVLGGFGGYSIRAVVVLASAAGAFAGIIDLQDLAEPGHHLHFPLLQLGVPILAFVGALVTALLALAAAKRDRAALAWSAARDGFSFNGMAATPEVVISESYFSEHERSLRAASLALFSIGMTSLVLAEIAEMASPEPAFGWIWGPAIAATLCALTAVVLPLFVEVRRAEMAYVGTLGDSVRTRGILVERRAD